MDKSLPGQQNYFEAFIKAAQYFAGLTVQQDIWSETGKVLVNFFGADVGAVEEKRANREAAGHRWAFSERYSGRRDLEAETGGAIDEVLESGFLSARIVFTPDPLSIACFPIIRQSQVIAVMVVGHGMAELLPRELFNVYLAVAGLVGTTGERLASDRELRRHRRQLEEEIAERKRAEKVTQARLRMLDTAYAAGVTLDDTLRLLLDEIEAQTGSCIAFYHFMEEDQQTLSLQSWSTNTLTTMCTAEGKGRHYPVSEAGVWVDCVLEKRPVIHNDYASLPHRKGLPPGHAPVIRELVVPVMRGDRIVAIIGVGNKPGDYNSTDVQIASLLGDFSWEIVKRKRTEESLLKLTEELEQRVRERTVELEAKIAEIEQLNKVFVGRELRMIELKERIRELEEKTAQSDAGPRP